MTKYPLSFSHHEIVTLERFYGGGGTDHTGVILSTYESKEMYDLPFKWELLRIFF